ncbi:translational activator GCN1-like, partial [Notothenia coriiceps]|uniref:Translational activator GCN1-like n=1 Tax=Notothenia coriiceps TaxID=8208 RepID=A0A6I9PP00_9TELE
MLGVCLDFCTAQKEKATIEKHKSAVLDLYIKSVLMSKTKPQQHILDRSSSFLRHVSHSEFKDLLLPTLQKTMLRSPENAMQSENSLHCVQTYNKAKRNTLRTTREEQGYWLLKVP